MKKALKVWLEEKQMSLIEFEKLSGVPYQRISGHIRNGTSLSERNTAKVLIATNNEVALDSLRPQLEEIMRISA